MTYIDQSIIISSDESLIIQHIFNENYKNNL